MLMMWPPYHGRELWRAESPARASEARRCPRSRQGDEPVVRRRSKLEVVEEERLVAGSRFAARGGRIVTVQKRITAGRVVGPEADEYDALRLVVGGEILHRKGANDDVVFAAPGAIDRPRYSIGLPVDHVAIHVAGRVDEFRRLVADP